MRTSPMSSWRVFSGSGKARSGTSLTTLAAWLLAITIPLASLGCKENKETSPADEATSEKSAQKTIGVTLLNVQDRFYQDLRDGLKSESEKLGYKILISTAEKDSSRQADQIDEFLFQEVDALVISPCDSRSVGASIVAANEKNVPVFTADIASTSDLGKVVTHIASDNRLGGVHAAKLLVEATGGKGKVAILTHPEVSSVMDRVAGFKEELGNHPELTVVAELSSEGKREKASRVTEDLLQTHPDLNGIFGINDATALGALATVEAAGKLEQIKIIGYDATPEARVKIKEGAIFGDVVQNPTLIGQLTVRAIHDHFQGKKLAPVIGVEVGTFTRNSP